jgi:hypothetical protein
MCQNHLRKYHQFLCHVNNTYALVLLKCLLNFQVPCVRGLNEV